MKSAIVLGSTGLIGRTIAKLLNSEGIRTLCIGRKALSNQEIIQCFGFPAFYIHCELEYIETLPKLIDTPTLSLFKGSVIYNLAWIGIPKLTEGGLGVQLSNVSQATKVIRTARELGCDRIIATGTLEETRAELALRNRQPFDSLQFDYTIAKLATRDMSLLVSYLEKIDYIHTRLSIALPADLGSHGYVATNLRSIISGNSYSPPKYLGPVDITSTDDIARALLLIGHYGKNKCDYYIGTGDSTTLSVYLKEFSEFVKGVRMIKGNDVINSKDSIFDISNLTRDTGFVPTTNRFTTFYSNN